MTIIILYSSSILSFLATHHAPPESVGVAGEIPFALPGILLLRQVHEVGREDQAQEADVEGRDQLLRRKAVTPLTDCGGTIFGVAVMGFR